MNEKMSDEKWMKKEVEVKKCTSRYVALSWTIECSQYERYWLMGFTSEEQQSTNQNKKNKKKLVRRTKKAQKMIPICAGAGRRKNSEAKISHAEKDMKNLPRSIQYYIVKKIQRISYPENYERKEQ